MSYIMRSFICNKIVQAISGVPIGGRGLKPSQFLPYIKICPKPSTAFEYELNLKPLHHINSEEKLLCDFDSTNIVEKIQTDDTITAAYYHDKSFHKIRLKVCSKKVIDEVVNLVCGRPESFWKSSPLFTLLPKQKIVVEFSSPNIAKPFHMGHLRSTVIGNCIANMLEAEGHSVKRINYLGDWGTQFGLLKYGYDSEQMSEEDLKENPIKALYKLYVKVNAEAEKSEKVFEEAKNIFSLMEAGDQNHLQTWKVFRDLSIQDFEKSYQRLNVKFDEYHGESMYKLDNCLTVLKLMEEKGVLKDLPDGRKVFKESDKSPNVTVVKSDGSTIYITRDIAAAVHRYEQLMFDQMIYVVDSSQSGHFSALVQILKSLGFEWASRLKHVNYGRITGMSTRKGTAVFLHDVLNEARDLRAFDQTMDKHTVFDDPSKNLEIADVVGISGIVTDCLKRKRTRDYSFAWEDALKSKGDTGVMLQYAHCRLVRLERTCNVRYNEDAELDSLVEPEVLHIVRHIARFDEVLYDACEDLEPNILAIYLMELSKHINSAYSTLPVKNTSDSTSQARLKLFRASRYTLAAGMRILGLIPLKQM